MTLWTSKGQFWHRGWKSFARVNFLGSDYEKSENKSFIEKRYYSSKRYFGNVDPSFDNPAENLSANGLQEFNPVSNAKLILETKWFLQKKPFRELLLRTHREQLWQSCRIVPSKNSHNFSAQNPKSVKNRWIFHINQLSSKWCSGHVKPNIVKPARKFPLECRKSFLKRRKRKKTISSSFSNCLYSTCSSGHIGGSFTKLSKISPQITESKLKFFQ